MGVVDDIIAYENGGLDAWETLDLFSRLVADGTVWQLQGHYGRAANALIEDGFLDVDGTITEYAERMLADAEEEAEEAAAAWLEEVNAT